MVHRPPVGLSHLAMAPDWQLDGNEEYKREESNLRLRANNQAELVCSADSLTFWP